MLGPKVPHYAVASRRASSKDSMRGVSPAAVNQAPADDDDSSFVLHKSAESESHLQDARRRRKSHSAGDAVSAISVDDDELISHTCGYEVSRIAE